MSINQKIGFNDFVVISLDDEQLKHLDSRYAVFNGLIAQVKGVNFECHDFVGLQNPLVFVKLDVFGVAGEHFFLADMVQKIDYQGDIKYKFIDFITSNLKDIYAKTGRVYGRDTRLVA